MRKRKTGLYYINHIKFVSKYKKVSKEAYDSYITLYNSILEYSSK